MPEIEIAKITIPGERQREDMGTKEELEELANSIFNPAIGFLNPITLDKDHILIAGMRRLTAHVMRGKKMIEYRLCDAETPYQKEIVELEENIRRMQLSWQEESKAVARIHAMKKEEDPDWTGHKTAALIGKSRRSVVGSVELAKVLEKDPGGDVAGAKTLRGAMDRHKRQKQIKKRVATAQVRMLAADQGLIKKVHAEVWAVDALVGLDKLDDASMDMAITNPPYGVDIESIFIGDRVIYDDAEEDIVPLLEKVVKEVYRVLRDDRWFVWFYPTSRLAEGARILGDAGFRFQAVPCIWYKPNKFVSALSHPYQQFSSQYETFFWGRKGDPKFTNTRLGNVFEFNTPKESDRLHPLQMPIDLWEEIITIGSVAGEHILEPFAGSGSGGVASIRMERNYTGLELSPEYAERANAWLAEELLGEMRDDGSATVAQPGVEDTAGFAALRDME